MPDTKFSFRALREHIRKYFWLYIVGVAVCLVLTSLLWTTTRPRVSNEQNVIVYLADGYASCDVLEPVAKDMLEKTQAFDETLREVEFQPLLLEDVAADMLAGAQAVDPAVKQVSFDSLMYNENEYTSAMLLMTRLAVGEGDAFLACQAAMDQLAHSGAIEPLDDYVAAGWLAKYGLEPYPVTLTDDEKGAKYQIDLYARFVVNE